MVQNKTYMAKPEMFAVVKKGAEPLEGSLSRTWYILDAEGQSLGRVATQAAHLLRGKHKPEYTPHVDTGDFVIIINADKTVLTGNKLTQKYYRRHSGYAGGLKETQYKTLMATRPELAFELAVKGMLTRTTLGRKALTRLKVYRGAEHPHAAQKPIVWGGNA